MDWKRIKCKNGVIWQSLTSNDYLISDEGGWLTGVYEDEKTARVALERKHEDNWKLLQKLQDMANARAGGTGGVIKFSDFYVA